MTRGRNFDRADKRLYLLVGSVVVCGSGLLAGALYVSLVSGQLNSWTAAGVTALAIVMSKVSVPVRVRATTHVFTSLSIAVLVGLSLLPAAAVLCCAAAAVTVTQILARRPLIKAAFNISKETLVAGAAAGAAHIMGGFTPGTGILDIAATVTVAALALFVADEMLAVPVISLASRTPMRQRLKVDWDIRIGGILAKTAFSVVAIPFIRAERWLLIAVPVVAISLHLAYANRIRVRGERQAWQTLAQSTEELNAVDLDGVMRVAVARASELFSADEIDVAIEMDTVPARLVRGGSDGITFDGPAEEAPVKPGRTIPTRLEGHPDEPDIGTLTLRFRGPVTLSEREEYTLQTFASALCTAIRNAAAYAELARLAERHAHNAAHDPLTGLANRRELHRIGGEALDQRPAHGIVALLLIDLNHFKEVNDTLGHAAGDRVLIEVARRLERAAGDDATVTRLGGDEFAIVLRGLNAPAMAAHRAQAVLSSLTEPIELDRLRISVEASIGIATAPSRGGISELLRRADIAMYQAKRAGSGTAVYARAKDTADVGRLTIGGELSRAVAEQEIRVLFQPIVDLATGEVLAAEALARWHHPDKGALDPQQFLEAVERSGVLPAFADAVLDQALIAAAEWREAGFDLPVAVNVSPRSLLDRRFPGSVVNRLKAHDTSPDRLILELTESLTLSQLDVVDQALGTLRDHGIRLALDDFGTGFSSLAMLSRVPVQELKIDREFIRDMETSAEAAAVVRSTVDLGRSLDLAVVAEGVESESQRRILWQLGCVAGQGHLFARPMPAARLLATLLRGSGGRPGTLAPPLHESGNVIRIPTSRRHQKQQPPASPEQQDRLPHWPA